MVKYEIPGSTKEIFENKEASYSIIDYTPGMDMDNIQSMKLFLDLVGVTEEELFFDSDTQVILQHPDYDFKLTIDSGGLGDFFSHGYDVSLYEE